MTSWAGSPERGAAWLVRLMLWLMRHVSWFANRVVLPGISLWFFLFSRNARAASMEYLSVALGRRASLWDVFKHIHVFACSILDRALLHTGLATALETEVTGLEALEASLATGRGCVLLGAHLGSFAVLRKLSATCPVPVRMMMYRANQGPFTRIMEALDPSLARDIIPIGDVHTLLRAHDAVAAGELVGMLADRVPAGARSVMAPFLGRPAAFPAGPFVLAASLNAPVFLFQGVRVGKGRYRIGFTQLGERVTLRRASREADLEAVVRRYAAWLESSCRAYPFNWFNFFPFWERAAHAPTQARPSVARPAAGVGAADGGAERLGAKPAAG